MRIGFLLSCGYFKDSNLFFTPQDFNARDIKSVAQELGLSGNNCTPESYTETTQRRHLSLILEFYGFQNFEDKAAILIQKEVEAMVSR